MTEICHFKDFFKVFTLFFPDLNLYSSPSSQVVTEGDTVNITCTAEGEPGLITFNKWSHSGDFVNDRSIAGEKYNNTSHLILHNISYVDTGTYKCHAENGIYKALPT